MTKKKKISAIILFVTILVLAGGYYVLKNINEKNEQKQAEEEAGETIEILSLDIDKIQSFSYQLWNEETEEMEKLRFKKEEDVWMSENNPELELEQSSITTMLNYTANITAERFVTDAADGLDEYGLDEPESELKFVNADGEETTIYIGAQNIHTTDYYVKVKTDANIYTISSSFVEVFQKSLEDLEVVAEEDEESDDSQADEE